MPCCGLHEYRERVPPKYTLSGGVVFWGAFLTAFLGSLLTIWSTLGRAVLRVQWNFLRALWMETMRARDSVPARLSCRLSGYLLNRSPRLAAFIYHHPEVPFVVAPALGLLCLVSAVAFLYFRR